MTVNSEPDLEPINIGTGVGTSIKELAKLTAKYMNYQGELKWDTSKPNGVMRKVLDVTRMNQALPEFTPISFEEGLQKTIKWYLENKESADSRE